MIMLKQYSGKDGIKALILYVLVMFSCLVQGMLYLSNLSHSALDFLQIPMTVIDIFFCFLFIRLSKESTKSIGITSENIRSSLIIGIATCGLLTAVIILFGTINGTIAFDNIMQMPSKQVLIIFVFAAFAEEIVFRGYLPTRICGITKNKWIGSSICALLFLSIHYPVQWVTSGTVSFDVLSLPHSAFLILLHFACDFVYKKTNCIWGSVVLHLLYNLILSKLIF